MNRIAIADRAECLRKRAGGSDPVGPFSFGGGAIAAAPGQGAIAAAARRHRSSKRITCRHYSPPTPTYSGAMPKRWRSRSKTRITDEISRASAAIIPICRTCGGIYDLGVSK